jgi:hypothetical protein
VRAPVPRLVAARSQGSPQHHRLRLAVAMRHLLREMHAVDG